MKFCTNFTVYIVINIIIGPIVFNVAAQPAETIGHAVIKHLGMHFGIIKIPKSETSIANNKLRKFQESRDHQQKYQENRKQRRKNQKHRRHTTCNNGAAVAVATTAAAAAESTSINSMSVTSNSEPVMSIPSTGINSPATTESTVDNQPGYTIFIFVTRTTTSSPTASTASSATTMLFGPST